MAGDATNSMMISALVSIRNLLVNFRNTARRTESRKQFERKIQARREK
jgi:hypothetical protein